jgi:urease accessory protein
MRAAVIIITGIAMTDTARDIYRLAAWLSPAFPVGAYTYSSGLEYAVEAGLVTDAASLKIWLEGLFRFGSGTIDGAFFCLAYRAAADEVALADCLDWADALRPTPELALESASQGDAFLKTVRIAWPHEGIERLIALAAERERKPAYAVAVGAVCCIHGLSLETALTAFLHAIAANLVSAALRAVPLGQTDGQRITAALEPVLAETAAVAQRQTLETLGAATPVADWASMQHETQHTRLFRS